jgi:hypothetical protein
MRRRIIWMVIGAPLALIVVGAGTALSMPAVRNIVSGFWNLPDRLPALADNALVHFEPGAEDFAHDVAALLQAAIARVEAVHGRPFARSVIVGAYATREAFAAANGLGSDVPVGVTFAGRVILSPKLFSPQHWRLRAILIHEMSHAHIQGWIGGNKYFQLPPWFKEGLAVMISGGGGAELVSEDTARAAIQRGEQIAIDDASSAQTTIDIRFTKPLEKQSPSWYPIVLAYRQAGMFVNYLRESDEPAFNRMLSAILDGRTFAEAVDIGYHEDVRSLWQKFAELGVGRK